jgi:transcriptional regulator with PAS, ATPase and Fis domain
MSQICENEPAHSPALIAVSTVFESFGRMLVCLDSSFRILHVSELLERMIGESAARALVGTPISNLVGEGLFAAGGAMRLALEQGERREGWRATITFADGSLRLVSLSAAPLIHDRYGICDMRVAYVIIIRPAEEDEAAGTISPVVFSGMIGRSAESLRLFHLVQNLQTSDATILLTGESGTGKEVLARAIHGNSTRRDGRFVAVNCAALPSELLESELFGHVRGSFTGAVRDRIGRVEMAAGGTLFLDEIGDMPLHLQAKILRFLQEKTFERVGESQTRKADVRVIAATHVELRKAIAETRFREDLYYRLRVVPIEMPPLRSRREDIEPLAHFLLGRVGARHGRAMRFSPDSLRAMLRYSWPGNVRELENAIEYAVAVGCGQTIQPEDLPGEITALENERRTEACTAPATDRDFLSGLLDQHHWRRDEVARTLGISRTTLWRRMREAGLR